MVYSQLCMSALHRQLLSLAIIATLEMGKEAPIKGQRAFAFRPHEAPFSQKSVRVSYQSMHISNSKKGIYIYIYIREALQYRHAEDREERRKGVYILLFFSLI